MLAQLNELNMKLKLLWPMIAATLMSSACSDTSMAGKALKPVIEYQCGQELKSSKVWKISTYLMSELQQQKLEQEVCGCIGEHALKDIPATTLLKATVDEELKAELTKQALANSLKGCATEYLQNK